MVKLRLDEIRSTDEKTQAKVLDEIKEMYDIFCKVDYGTHLERKTTSYQRMLEDGPMFGEKTIEWEKEMKDKFALTQLELEKFVQTATYEQSTIHGSTKYGFYNPSESIMHSLTKDARTPGFGNYTYRFGSYILGGRAHLIFDLSKEFSTLYVRSNFKSNLLEDEFRNKVFKQWNEADFLTR